jgi:hypothetical protein
MNKETEKILTGAITIDDNKGGRKNPAETSNFVELFKASNIILDKTELAWKIGESSGSKLFALPEGCMKNTNLSMIHFFNSLRFDEAGNLMVSII